MQATESKTKMQSKVAQRRQHFRLAHHAPVCIVRLVHARQTKVADLEVAVGVDEQITRLQITAK